MRRKILFRADGNAVTGLGHLYRVFAAVEMLRANYDFCLLTKASSTISVIPQYYPVEFVSDELSYDDEPAWLENTHDPRKHIIWADGYQFGGNYQKRIKELEYQLVYVDDTTTEHMYADIVLNHAPGLEADDFHHEPYTKLALGTDYALLRPIFLEKAKATTKIEKIDAVFICFGGADKYNLSLKAAIGALEIDDILKVQVVLGGANNHDELMDLKGKYGNRLVIHKNLSASDLLKVMASCNFGIVPTSTIFYELCCVKMPILAGFYVENQLRIYSTMAKKGVLIEAGDFKTYSAEKFRLRLKQVIGAIAPSIFVKKQQVLFDGLSGKRILGLVGSLNISFKWADEEDLRRTYEWANDIEVRKNSYETKEISLKDHTSWFKKKIADSNTMFLIADVNGVPAGIVRYEIDLSQTVVGILIQPAFRGQGLASDFLRKSAKLYFSRHDQPIFAYIKTGNRASVRSFEKAGYIFFEQKKVKGVDSYIYQLEGHYVK